MVEHLDEAKAARPHRSIRTLMMLSAYISGFVNIIGLALEHNTHCFRPAMSASRSFLSLKPSAQKNASMCGNSYRPFMRFQDSNITANCKSCLQVVCVYILLYSLVSFASMLLFCTKNIYKFLSHYALHNQIWHAFHYRFVV